MAYCVALLRYFLRLVAGKLLFDLVFGGLRQLRGLRQSLQIYTHSDVREKGTLFVPYYVGLALVHGSNGPGTSSDPPARTCAAPPGTTVSRTVWVSTQGDGGSSG